MEQEQIINKLDTIINLLNNIVNSDANNLNNEAKAKGRKKEIDLVNILKANNLPSDIDYIEDIKNIIDKLELEASEVEEVFKNLDRYQQENDINDIKKLSFKFLYNFKRNQETGSYTKRRKRKGK